jgi:DNA (cytosine-5)-methyltransferase 1
MGYHLAGLDVTGVDIAPQPNYPFPCYQADAIEFIRKHGHEYDLIHASPPCQADCTLTAGTNQRLDKGYVNLTAETRDALMATGRPWILEQPIGKAEMRRDVMLCGLMFDLKVFRHRQFEMHGLLIAEPAHPTHKGHRVKGWRHGRVHDGDMVSVYGSGGYKGSVSEWQDAMDVHWTDRRYELAQAIPPAYTEYLGKAALQAIA